ncbi:MAG: hypothetical protein OWS74_06295 [Firmicutes bacterium]|nr:hypothetical protein [Bacillota bacterium]
MDSSYAVAGFIGLLLLYSSYRWGYAKGMRRGADLGAARQALASRQEALASGHCPVCRQETSSQEKPSAPPVAPS